MDDWLSHAIDRARQLNGTEIVVAAARKQKRMLGEMVELLRATPLPVKLLPDAAVRSIISVYKSTARFELWSISYVRIAPRTLTILQTIETK